MAMAMGAVVGAVMTMGRGIETRSLDRKRVVGSVGTVEALGAGMNALAIGLRGRIEQVESGEVEVEVEVEAVVCSTRAGGTVLAP